MSFVLVIIVMLSIYGGANFYTARKLFQFIGSCSVNLNAVLFAVLYILLALTIVLGYTPLPFGINRLMRLIGSYWTGFFMYLFILFIAADLIILLGRLFNLIQVSMLNSARFYSGLTVIVLTVAVVFYGIFNANQYKIVNYEVQLKDSSLSGMRIVLISDLHLGEVNSEKNLDKMAAAVNALNPDIVCIAGDIFNDDYYAIRNPDRAINLFKSINAAYGVYACLGNHDGGRTLDQMINFLEESNIKLLNDEYVIIDERLALFGRLDARPIGGSGNLKRRNITEAIASTGANMPVIVMDHNPAHINEYGGEVDLILSGHTHRGQMFPGSLFTRALFTVDYGHYQKDTDSPNVIVTSGAGTWFPPMRIGSNNEIVNILLR